MALVYLDVYVQGKKISKVNGRPLWARELLFVRSMTIFAIDMVVGVENWKLLGRIH